MPLIDRSAGGFIALANVIVFGVVGAEIWMWTVATTAAIAVTLALIAVVAGVICAAVLHVMDDAPVTVAPVQAAVERAASPQPARGLAPMDPARGRRPVAA